MQLSVIIVNYNVKYFLEQALLSVDQASRGLAVEVFVVDNNSVDDSVAMVQEKFPHVHLIANKDNPGFSIANNQAIRQSTGKYVLLLNPDTVVEEDTFIKCWEFMEAHPDAGGLGVRMIDGSGKFLPESKRGFPSPLVAFSKTFGLSSIFPKSKVFNHYHLGYLDEFETHEVEVLAGAFMFMRRETLDKIGLLDETFFMYGEDIDLSYRIIKGGYKNYYLPETTIIHYKGESTKRGSLNYVKAFYNAMIIFAKKHFSGSQASVFVGMLKVAIYLRAMMTIVANLAKKTALPLLDGILIFGGLLLLKDFWASYHFNDPNYYDNSPLLTFSFPLYTATWITSIYFSGGYDNQRGIRRLVRGLMIGTLLLTAIYGLLDMEYRSSRALILIGAAWSVFVTIGVRLFRHFIKYKDFKLSNDVTRRLVIVGSVQEGKRVRELLTQAEVFPNLIGLVAPAVDKKEKEHLNSIHQLEEIVQVYQLDEIIFCGKDVAASEIMQWMSSIGPKIDYKIVPPQGISIIGSTSKNSQGQLYTVDIQFDIATTIQRRNKRFLDIVTCGSLLLILPLVLFSKQRKKILNNWLQVFMGRKSWVGYGQASPKQLPKIKPGVFVPSDAFSSTPLDEATLNHLDFLYAKDYHPSKDVEVIWNSFF